MSKKRQFRIVREVRVRARRSQPTEFHKELSKVVWNGDAEDEFQALLKALRARCHITDFLPDLMRRFGEACVNFRLEERRRNLRYFMHSSLPLASRKWHIVAHDLDHETNWRKLPQ